MQHIQLVCGKLSRTAGIMTRIRNFVPWNVLLNLYYSLVYPYLSYRILIWGGAADIYIQPLFILQKRIIRIITSLNFLDHNSPLFRQTNCASFLVLVTLKHFCVAMCVAIYFHVIIQVGLNMHLYEDIVNASSSLRGSTSNLSSSRRGFKPRHPTISARDHIKPRHPACGL